MTSPQPRRTPSTLSPDPAALHGPPRFSAAEMTRRREALDGAMARAGVDAVVLYGANKAGSAVQWLTGWPVTREAAVVHRPGERDRLLVNFFNHVPQARRTALDADVAWAGPDLGATLVEALAGAGRLGVVGAVPFGLYRTLGTVAGEPVDLNRAYTGLRLRKSAEEVEWLRAAARLTDLSCAALRDGARVGDLEYQLGALVEAAYLPLGGTNYIHYFSVTSMAEPTQCVPSQWPGPRPLGAGDVLSCELSTSYGVDYPGQLLRTFTVGAEATPLYADLHAVADAALDRVEDVLRPGATAEEIVEAASVIEAAGYTTVDDLVHGLGGAYLPPIIGSASRTLEPLTTQVVEAGMTLVVQPNVTTTDGLAGVQTGELFHVTATGCERLHDFPRGLGRIA
ncbi:MAG: xaa-Pro aminopeptidase [Nocardioides sp.]|nr:xaa-Pro aminopeptidase [Nocardioides sp.]